MSYLLDTNVVSELRRRDRTHPAVARWADAVVADELHLSAISILEIEVGALRVARHDPAQGHLLLDWLERRVLPAFSGRILPVDAAVARRCAGLNVPDPRPLRDAMIAATALVHGLTVVTRNLRDFALMGGATLNPWEYA